MDRESRRGEKEESRGLPHWLSYRLGVGPPEDATAPRLYCGHLACPVS